MTSDFVLGIMELAVISPITYRQLFTSTKIMRVAFLMIVLDEIYKIRRISGALVKWKFLISIIKFAGRKFSQIQNFSSIHEGKNMPGKILIVPNNWIGFFFFEIWELVINWFKYLPIVKQKYFNTVNWFWTIFIQGNMERT